MPIWNRCAKSQKEELWGVWSLASVEDAFHPVNFYSLSGKHAARREIMRFPDFAEVRKCPLIF